MKYFSFKTVTDQFTTKSIVIPDGTIAFQYNDNLAGVDIEESQKFIEVQHPECEVTEMLFIEIEQTIKESRMYHDMNKIIQTLIADRYSIADEIKMLKLAVDDSERVKYQNYVDECRSVGRALKIEKGLITN